MVRDGILYGLGTSDMKAAVGANPALVSGWIWAGSGDQLSDKLDQLSLASPKTSENALRARRRREPPRMLVPPLSKTHYLGAHPTPCQVSTSSA